MQHIGIFGGSFNPIHTGHIALAKSIMHIGGLDEIWLVVSPQNPFKVGNGSLIDDHTRLQLVRKALEGEDRMTASDIEFQLPKPSFMWNTLQELSTRHPDKEFTLIIGADNWSVFDKWYHADDIRKRYRIIVYPRDGYPLSEDEMPQGVTLINTQLYPISSTMIRQKTADGEDISGLVPERIENEVKLIYG